jgi:N-acetylmuramoyl-L-alanine amidase
VIIDDIFMLPKSGDAKDRLVIDLAPVSANVFAAKEKIVFGNANIRAAAGMTKPPVSEFARTEAVALEKMSVPTPQRKPPQNMLQKKKDKYVIVVDAGHGGDDPGALGPHRIREKDITLQVARELQRALENTGRYRVVMTRERDEYIKLRDRVDISRRRGGDLFVSIHADKIGRSAVRGASIYTLSSEASDAESARLAEQENNAGVVAGVDLAVESADVANILLDLAMREKMNESNLLARYLVESFRRENVRLLPNSHRSAGFAVLKAPDVPSVLIETGFLSNPEEAKLLSSSVFQRKVATAIVSGIDAYFTKIQALQKD